MNNNNERMNYEDYNNNENLSEKASEEHKYTEFYGHKSETNTIFKAIKKNQTQYEIKFTLEDNKNNHYICRECNSFPLIKIIKDEPTIKLLLICENHKEENELNKCINRILNKEKDLYSYQYCKIHNKEKEEREIFLKACLNCKMNLC